VSRNFSSVNRKFIDLIQKNLNLLDDKFILKTLILKIRCLHRNSSHVDHKSFQNLLYKIIQEPDHPITSNLLKSPRSTSVLCLYKTNIAKTEAQFPTPTQKYQTPQIRTNNTIQIKSIP